MAAVTARQVIKHVPRGVGAAEHGLGEAEQDAVSLALREASASRRAARWTTLLTATATVTNSTRARRFLGSAIVNVCSGAVKYQFSSRQAPIAANTAGQNPPMTVTATTTTR